MKVRVKTRDGEVHVFSDTDKIEPLQQYHYDSNLHIFRMKTGPAEYGFPLENILWVKMIEKEM